MPELMFNEIWFKLNENDKYDVELIKKYLYSNYNFIQEHPQAINDKRFENHYLLCDSQSSLNDAINMPNTSGCCYITLNYNNISINLNTFEKPQQLGIQFVLWIYKQYKNKLLMIRDDWGHDWIEEVQKNGISIIFK